DGVDTQSKVPDEQHLKTTGIDERTCTIQGILDVPKYYYETNKESWEDSGEEEDNNDDSNDDDGGGDDHDDNSDDKKMKSNRDEIPDPNMTNVDQTGHEEEDVNERVHTPSDNELFDDEKIYNP
nr:hypothetical protein [Tanacetum cinerariifolium]